MENSSQIAIRFKEVFLNGKWIANTNYKDLLSNVSWQQATHKIGSLNTIATLTNHINYYVAGVLNVFDGGSLEIKDKYSFDFPPIKSKEDWENQLNDLNTNAKKFAKHIEAMSDEKLDEIFEKEEYGTYRRNIEGIIEHSYYHLGQISLIKKLILQENKN